MGSNNILINAFLRFPFSTFRLNLYLVLIIALHWQSTHNNTKECGRVSKKVGVVIVQKFEWSTTSRDFSSLFFWSFRKFISYGTPGLVLFLKGTPFLSENLTWAAQKTCNLGQDSFYLCSLLPFFRRPHPSYISTKVSYETKHRQMLYALWWTAKNEEGLELTKKS